MRQQKSKLISHAPDKRYAWRQIEVPGGIRRAGANGKSFWERLDKTVQVAIVTVIGSILTALIAFFTTIITIELNGKGINDNSSKLDALATQASVLQKRADDVERKLAQMEAPSVPVGTVVASFLTPAQFAQAVGDPNNFDIKKSKWIFANSKKAIPGTDWAAMTGNADLPDLRGVFLRGQNLGAFGNVAEIGLGISQPDTVGAHQHLQAVSNDGHGVHGFGIVYKEGDTTTGIDRFVLPSNPGAETVVKNVTVNYYIRINR